MKPTKITKPIADAAEPNASRYVLWDADLSGFGLRVTPSGAKTWVLKYRAGEGGRNAAVRWFTLGSHPEMTASSARDAAKKALAQVQLGDDPAGDRQAKRKELSIAGLIDRYEQEGLFVQRGARIGAPMKPLTAKYTMARLRHHVVPLLGARRASEVTEGDIERFFRQVAEGRSAKDEKAGAHSRIIVRGGEGAARKVVRDLSAVFAFAMRHQIVTSNPVTMASVRKTDNQRERFLSIEEIGRLGEALEALEAEGVNPKAVNIARLWALSGCRRNEIASLSWEEVDFERGLLILGDTKTGRSIRPLGGAALALLQSLKNETADTTGYVFPAERGDGFYQGTKRVWQNAIKKAELPGVTPHVLRHTLGSAAASAGEALLMVGSLLGHANARSSAIYAHIAHDPARLAADRVTAPLAKALGMSAEERAF